jgi:hypothetical protein
MCKQDMRKQDMRVDDHVVQTKGGVMRTMIVIRILVKVRTPSPSSRSWRSTSTTKVCPFEGRTTVIFTDVNS